MIVLNDTGFKKGFIAIALYPLMFVLAFIFEAIVPSDMCNPGFGLMFMLFFLPIFAITMLVINFRKITKHGKIYRAPFFMHLLACLILFGCFIYLTIG